MLLFKRLAFSNLKYKIKFNSFQKSINILHKINKKFILDMEAKKEESKFTFVKDEQDVCKDYYGVIPLITSQYDPELRHQSSWTEISKLNDSTVGQKVKLRARLQRSRIKGAGGFLVLRQGFNTLQGVIFTAEKISKQMIKFINTIPLESIVDVEGEVTAAKNSVESCTQKTIELNVSQIFLTVESTSILPFQLEDANRKGNPEDEEDEVVQETVPSTPDSTLVPEEMPNGA